MRPWAIFIIGTVFIVILIISGVVWSRRKAASPDVNKNSKDVQLLWFFLCLAAFSLLGYVSFVFGKR